MDAERDYGGRRTTLLASVACELFEESTEEREEVQLVSSKDSSGTDNKVRTSFHLSPFLLAARRRTLRCSGRPA